MFVVLTSLITVQNDGDFWQPGFYTLISYFLNQARRPVHAWFLKIDPVQIVCMRACVCPRPRLIITNGMMWRDIDLIRLVKQVLQLLYDDCSRYR